MSLSKHEHAHLARTTRGRWVSTCLSAVLVLAAACGDDDTDDGSPTAPGLDGGSTDAGSTAPDAAPPPPADAGQTPDAAPPTPDASTGDSDAGGGDAPSAAALRGKALAEENVCSSCHRASYEGAAFYPNITPDMATGIGTWTDEEIKRAIAEGEGKGNDQLCSLMMRYEFSAGELDDLVAFLRSLAPVSKNITAACTAD